MCIVHHWQLPCEPVHTYSSRCSSRFVKLLSRLHPYSHISHVHISTISLSKHRQSGLPFSPLRTTFPLSPCLSLSLKGRALAQILAPAKRRLFHAHTPLPLESHSSSQGTGTPLQAAHSHPHARSSVTADPESRGQGTWRKNCQRSALCTASLQFHNICIAAASHYYYTLPVALPEHAPCASSCCCCCCCSLCHRVLSSSPSPAFSHLQQTDNCPNRE